MRHRLLKTIIGILLLSIWFTSSADAGSMANKGVATECEVNESAPGASMLLPIQHPGETHCCPSRHPWLRQENHKCYDSRHDCEGHHDGEPHEDYHCDRVPCRSSEHRDHHDKH